MSVVLNFSRIWRWTEQAQEFCFTLEVCEPHSTTSSVRNQKGGWNEMFFHCFSSPISLFNVCNCHKTITEFYLVMPWKYYEISEWVNCSIQHLSWYKEMPDSWMWNITPVSQKDGRCFVLWKSSIKVIFLWLALL